MGGIIYFILFIDTHKNIRQYHDEMNMAGVELARAQGPGAPKVAH